MKLKIGHEENSEKELKVKKIVKLQACEFVSEFSKQTKRISLHVFSHLKHRIEIEDFTKEKRLNS